MIGTSFFEAAHFVLAVFYYLNGKLMSTKELLTVTLRFFLAEVLLILVLVHLKPRKEIAQQFKTFPYPSLHTESLSIACLGDLQTYKFTSLCAK